MHKEIIMDDNRFKVRKQKLIKQTVMVALGYFIVMIAIVGARLFNITSIEIWQIIFCGALSLGSMGIYLLAIFFMKKISHGKANFIYVTQFLLWLTLYFFFVYWLKEVRIASLLFAIMALVFVLSNSTLIQSLALTLGATMITLIASYIAVYHSNQPGNFKYELFFILCFIPSAIYLSYMAGEFKKQKRELSISKKAAEDARDALWGEMELARKIQTVLLPEDPHMDGYEISAYMEPADEVGGDYYDVINVKDKDWIVIGDVSGHGVTAGLVMMMVQTSIHIGLETFPDATPSDLLVKINKIISHNIHQLGDDKYMTITVIAALDHGKFYFAGLHQDILIYRGQTSDVESIETRGMWIGVLEDIDGLIGDDNFVLQKDDTILFYTDGITEASIESKDEDGKVIQKMYGDERLLYTFKKCGSESTEVIKRTLIDSLKEYSYSDDITFLLLKKTS